VEIRITAGPFTRALIPQATLTEIACAAVAQTDGHPGWQRGRTYRFDFHCRDRTWIALAVHHGGNIEVIFGPPDEFTWHAHDGQNRVTP
jgi:hypothetical protein